MKDGTILRRIIHHSVIEVGVSDAQARVDASSTLVVQLHVLIAVLPALSCLQANLFQEQLSGHCEMPTSGMCLNAFISNLSHIFRASGASVETLQEIMKWKNGMFFLPSGLKMRSKAVGNVVAAVWFPWAD